MLLQVRGRSDRDNVPSEQAEAAQVFNPIVGDEMAKPQAKKRAVKRSTAGNSRALFNAAHADSKRISASKIYDLWVDVLGTPMHNAAGVFKGVVGTFSVSSELLPKVDQRRGQRQ